MSGLTDKLSGKAKQAAGNATDNNQLKAEGKAEEAKGTIKEKFNEAVDTVSDKVDEIKKKNDK